MYVINKDVKLSKGGRIISSANIEKELTSNQIEQLIKNKSIKKVKEKRDGKESGES